MNGKKSERERERERDFCHESCFRERLIEVIQVH